MAELSRSSIVRFFGVDLQKPFLYIVAVNSLQQIVLKPLKISLENWPAWAAVIFDPYGKGEFERLSQRLVPGKAIVAIARRLLVVL